MGLAVARAEIGPSYVHSDYIRVPMSFANFLLFCVYWLRERCVEI